MARQSFSDKLRKIANKQLKEVDQSVCKIARDFCHSVVELTPVGKSEYESRGGRTWENIPGELVNNWQPAVNSINTSLQQRPGPSKTGAHKRIDTTIVNGTFKQDAYISFTNATPYVNLAEKIGWPEPRWSGKTGPYAMVSRSIAEILSKYGY